MAEGHDGASDQLIELVYDELRRLAAAKLSHEKPGQTIQATALVHEAYMRLAGGASEIRWENRAHFFSAAAETMRRLLIDTARRKKTQKHGGGLQQVSIDLTSVTSNDRDGDLLALDHALEKLASIDATKAKLVELRFFAGLTNEQAAKTLGIGVSTAESYWAYSRSWLRAEISRFQSE
ncbi:MAG: ECF-type sigma factor [Planctomycetota bacterium]